ncbi:MAG: response regulator [Bacteroidales bacterium]|jgi:CheY-like chemotaxis protein|nr:response regulator [Bacteroidales bacterium]
MKKYNILIVDDIFTNRLLLKEVLCGISYSLKEAENGKVAIDIIYNEDIDIVFMDIEMPVMNGIETTKYIRSEMALPKRSIPIIALTAHNPDDFFENFSDAGFDQLLTKPYSFNKILKAIESFEI